MEKKWQLGTAVAFGALCIGIFIWRAFAGTNTVAGLICGGAMLLLFVAVGVRFCAKPFACLAGEGADPNAGLGERSLRRARRHPWGSIILFVLLSRVAVYVAAYALYSLGRDYPGGILDTLQTLWLRSDSPSYLGIANNWYVTVGDPRFHIVFFPFYPCCIWLFDNVINNTFLSAMLVSTLCSMAAAVFVYEAAAVDMDRQAALRAVRYAFILPAAFFMAAPMTEALFVMLSAGAICFTRRKQYLLACIFAGLSAFTRSVGGLMLGLIAWEIIEDIIACEKAEKLGENKKRITLAALCLLIVPLGLAGYIYINYAVTGDPFKFMQYQKEHWSQSFGFFFESGATQLNNAISAGKGGNTALLTQLFLPNLLASFGALGIMFGASKRLRPSYIVYFLAYFAVSCGATWLLSSPRYLTACVPLFFAFAALGDDVRYDAGISLVLLCLQTIYLAMYVTGGYVY